MALDGIVVSNIVAELKESLVGGRITKIAQPEKDALLLTIKNEGKVRRLFLSAGAGLPLIYLTGENKPSPLTAPNFCMLLRKYINNARIMDVKQEKLERVIHIVLEHYNELGDLCKKILVIELMGKHSNIILCDEDFIILDSIKRISSLVSSVREVLPGRNYFIPNTMEKLDPFSFTLDDFHKTMASKSTPIYKALYSSITGLSPLISNEICHRCGIDPDTHTSILREADVVSLYDTILGLMERVRKGDFEPNILYEGNEPIEFSSLPLSLYSHMDRKRFTSISEVLERFYSMKETLSRIRQKSIDLRKIVGNALERNRKKLDIQSKQWKDTEKRDKFKVYGELLNTYGYDAKKGDKSLTCMNYYTNEEITIPLDINLTPLENAKKYFDKYNKLKRTYEALTKQMVETKEEIAHLESISNALDIATTEEDLVAVKEELVQYGHMKKKPIQAKQKGRKLAKSKPFHYLSSDGFHMYVGKNNFQNEEITFEWAADQDWWFHAKGLAGSHVIVKTNGKELPDRTFEEAGRLAGYYSKARGNDKVEIDYTEKKNVKKPKGSKPGFVVYYTNYSLVMPADKEGIQEVED